MNIKELTEKFENLENIMANDTEKVTTLDPVLSDAITVERKFYTNAAGVEKKLVDDADEIVADKKDDKEAVGKDRDYDLEHPTKIVDNEYTNPKKYVKGKDKLTLEESSANLTLSENGCTKKGHKLSLSEDMAASIMTNSTKVMASGWTDRTRTYVREHVDFQWGYKHGEGLYKWMNRPWQRFTYAEALRDAMIDAGVEEKIANRCIDSSSDLQSALDEFVKIVDTKSDFTDAPYPDTLGESVGKTISEYQKWVDYDMKKYGKVSLDTMSLIKRAGLTLVKDEYGDWEVIAKEPIHEIYEPASSFKSWEFMNKTSQGWKIVKIYRDLNDDRLHIIFYRPKRDDYGVGLGYSPDSGSWNQGWYDFGTDIEAKDALFKNYDVEPFVRDFHEDTVKSGNKWVNKGKEGTHGSFKTKKAADAQRRAMFANSDKNRNFGESWNEEFTKVLWSNGDVSIIDDEYGFGIDDGDTVNRFTIYDDGRFVFDCPECVDEETRIALKRLLKDGKFDNPYYRGGDAKFVGNTLKYGHGVKESKLTEAPVYDLETQYDARKSFYSKAKVDVKPDGTQILYSYNTPVCKITKTNAVKLLPRWDESQTTLRHVKEFLRQNGFEAVSKSQIERDYEFSRDAVTEGMMNEKLYTIPYNVRSNSKDARLANYDKKEFDIELSDKDVEYLKGLYNYISTKSYQHIKNTGEFNKQPGILIFTDKVADKYFDKDSDPLYMDKAKGLVNWVLDLVDETEHHNKKDFGGWEGRSDVLYSVVYDRLFGGTISRYTTYGICPDITVFGENTYDDSYAVYLSGKKPGTYIALRAPSAKDKEHRDAYASARRAQETGDNVGDDELVKAFLYARSGDAGVKVSSKEDRKREEKYIDNYFNLMRCVADRLGLRFEIKELGEDVYIGIIFFDGSEDTEFDEYAEQHPELNLFDIDLRPNVSSINSGEKRRQKRIKNS